MSKKRKEKKFVDKLVYDEAHRLKSTNVPTGEWTDVKRGMTMAEGCYVDDKGVMRFIENDAPAVWHHKSTCPNHQPPCDKRITDAADIVYDDHGAPWCANCIGWTSVDLEIKELERQFGGAGN